MARVKLTEYKAKSLLMQQLGRSYRGISLVKNSDAKIPSDKLYVVKVDQGVKKRMKNGLVKLKVKASDVGTAVAELSQKGYSRFLAEEFVAYDQNDERYLALERTREGITITYSEKGGIDIEENLDSLKRFVFSKENLELQTIEKELTLPAGFLARIVEFFENYYVSFLEINPLVINGMHILDLAVEVDSTAQFLVKGAWGEADIVASSFKTDEEKAVADLNKKSQAALSLTVLNPNGSIWVLLSGGGASITIADEIYNLGYGKELGNYGEYSGNPTAEETYLYTKQILELLSHSDKKKMVLLIGGGVANFTDIRITFKGLVQALQEKKEELKKKNVKLFVRRGGPHQEEGLKLIEAFAKKENMLGVVSGPQMSLHEIVQATVNELH